MSEGVCRCRTDIDESVEHGHFKSVVPEDHSLVWEVIYSMLVERIHIVNCPTKKRVFVTTKIFVLFRNTYRYDF